MPLYGTPQFNKVTTIAVGSTLNPPATSTILASPVFGSPSGTQILVVDYGNSNAAVISCTIAGTSLSSVSYLDGNVAANHAAGASVTMAFTPNQYASLIDGSGLQFPAWTTHASTIGGFSGTPTQANRYFQLGKILFYKFDITGTSLTTALTFTIPSPASNSTRYGGYYVTDNTVDQSVPGAIATAGGGTTVSCFRDMTGSAWTNVGSKAIRGLLVCELA
jgi:hypothetical protein